jgi:predicted nucleic acid-binding protein
MTVVDASVWVSSLVAQDIHYEASRVWLNQRLASEDDLVVPWLALAEVAGAISRRTRRSQLGRQAAADMLLAPGLRLVSLDAALGERAVELAAACLLRGADAVYVAVAQALAMTLITWDEEVQSRACTVITVEHP